VARSSFQGRTWGIPGSIFRGNNAWPVHMSQISSPSLVARKPVRKPKKIKIIKVSKVYDLRDHNEKKKLEKLNKI
jgi:hypothetical protein